MVVVTRKVDAKSRVVLPERFAGATVVIHDDSDELRIVVAKAPRKRPSLKSLLAGITKKNTHAAVEFGRPVGEEKV